MTHAKMSADQRVRIIMLGESGVGKTSLMLRFCKNVFRDGHKCTVIIDSYNKSIFLDNTKVELELWDTAGQERFKGIVKEYFRKAEGVLLAYDMTNLATFMKLSNWLSELREINETATVFIVGNKADLQHQNQVSRTTVENYARDEGLEFCETSAKENMNVDEVFKKLALKVLQKKKIFPFVKEMVNGAIKAEMADHAASGSCQLETENCQRENDKKLPPIIRLDDGDHVIKLTMEKPKEKKKKSRC